MEIIRSEKLLRSHLLHTTSAPSMESYLFSSIADHEPSEGHWPAQELYLRSGSPHYRSWTHRKCATRTSESTSRSLTYIPRHTCSQCLYDQRGLYTSTNHWTLQLSFNSQIVPGRTFHLCNDVLNCRDQLYRSCRASSFHETSSHIQTSELSLLSSLLRPAGIWQVTSTTEQIVSSMQRSCLDHYIHVGHCLKCSLYEPLYLL